MGITKYDKFERFVHAIFLVSSMLVTKYVGDGLVTNIHYRFTLASGTNIKKMLPTSKFCHRYPKIVYIYRTIFLTQIFKLVKKSIFVGRFFQFLAEIIDSSINYTLSICHYFVAINFDASL